MLEEVAGQGAEPQWIEWGPDSPGYPKCPVAPGTDCEVRFRDGLTERDREPEEYGWCHSASSKWPCDIIAYRVWPAKDDARALLVEARGYVNDCLASAEPSPERVGLLARIDAYLERNP